MKTFTLLPTNGRKSFGGKARVIIVDGTAQLLSYDTVVASVNLETNTYVQERDDWSVTTKSHIKSFREFYNI